jgi:hypothetical protein
VTRAEVELGGPAFDFGLVDKIDLWTDDAARLYARAAARRTSLVRLGFSDVEAQALSQLHTRNFM